MSTGANMEMFFCLDSVLHMYPSRKSSDWQSQPEKTGFPSYLFPKRTIFVHLFLDVFVCVCWVGMDGVEIYFKLSKGKKNNTTSSLGHSTLPQMLGTQGLYAYKVKEDLLNLQKRVPEQLKSLNDGWPIKAD